MRCALLRRDMVPGLYYSVIGMCAGGYGKVKIAPHFMYPKGYGTVIKPNSMLVIEIWLDSIIPPG